MLTRFPFRECDIIHFILYAYIDFDIYNYQDLSIQNSNIHRADRRL